MEIKNKEEFFGKIANGVSIVDFYAQWCGPCVHFAPIFNKFAKEFEGKANFCKVDIDNIPEIASDYGVMSIPTLIVLKNGIEVARQIGAMNEINFRMWINKFID